MHCLPEETFARSANDTTQSNEDELKVYWKPSGEADEFQVWGWKTEDFTDIS